MKSCEDLLQSFVGLSNEFFWHTLAFDGLFLLLSGAAISVLLYLAWLILTIDVYDLNVDLESFSERRISQIKIGLASFSFLLSFTVFFVWTKYYLWSIFLTIFSPRLRFLHHISQNFSC